MKLLCRPCFRIRPSLGRFYEASSRAPTCPAEVSRPGYLPPSPLLVAVRPRASRSIPRSPLLLPPLSSLPVEAPPLWWSPPPPRSRQAGKGGCIFPPPLIRPPWHVAVRLSAPVRACPRFPSPSPRATTPSRFAWTRLQRVDQAEAVGDTGHAHARADASGNPLAWERKGERQDEPEWVHGERPNACRA